MRRDFFKTNGRPNASAAGGGVQEEADKLEAFRPITSCRVIVETPHRHHRRGEPFPIRIELAVPGKELVFTREPTLKQKRVSMKGDRHDYSTDRK